MEAALNELPLALFTTLAPMGAGAFVALACALFTTTFSDEQLKKIDRFMAIPLIVVLVGFVASFFHLASPLHAPLVFAGVGSSPLSNEIVAGCIFTVLAVVYWIMGVTGKLPASARKGFAAVVAVAAIVFACFTGLAYVMDTIASWNSPLVPVQFAGFALTGGMALGALVLTQDEQSALRLCEDLNLFAGEPIAWHYPERELTLGEVEGISRELEKAVAFDDKALSIIETASKEYHEAGRHLKNIVRAVQGCEALDAPKGPGALARGLSLPFRQDRRLMCAMQSRTAGALKRLEHLEQAARPPIRQTMEECAKLARAQESKERAAPAVSREAR